MPCSWTVVNQVRSLTFFLLIMLHVHLFLNPLITCYCVHILFCFVHCFFATCSFVGCYLRHRFASTLVWYLSHLFVWFFLIITANHYWTSVVIATFIGQSFVFIHTISGWAIQQLILYCITFRINFWKSVDKWICLFCKSLKLNLVMSVC